MDRSSSGNFARRATVLDPIAVRASRVCARSQPRRFSRRSKAEPCCRLSRLELEPHVGASRDPPAASGARAHPFVQPFSTTPSPQSMCRLNAGGFGNPLAGPRWNGWGVNTANTRYQDGSMAGIGEKDIPRLKVKWAFGFPGELSADAQPTMAGGRVFVGSQSGTVYALNAATGCIHWHFQAASAVRAAVTIASIATSSGRRYAAFIGDRSGNVYAVDAATGALL